MIFSVLGNWEDNEAILINKSLQKRSRSVGKHEMGVGGGGWYAESEMPVGHTGGDRQGEEMQVWSASQPWAPTLAEGPISYFQPRFSVLELPCTLVSDTG